MRFIDSFLNRTAMYRLVLYCLTFLTVVSLVLSVCGILSYSIVSLLLSLVIVLCVCMGVNMIFSYLWKVPTNVESSYITAFILFFLFSPVMSTADAIVLASASAIAMASKYLIAYRGKHIFNPAAFAAAALALTQTGIAVWWIGTAWMLPFTLIAGLLIVRKIRKFALFLACVIASFLTVIVLGAVNNVGIVESVVQHAVSWPIIFFASVMVTEPLTMPPRRHQQILYGAVIGVFSSWPIVIGPVYSTPELVLVLCNIYSAVTGMHRRLTLRLKEKFLVARETWEYVFTVHPPITFLPGQYLEWTLPHPHSDDRGNRRYFTVASSPTEKDIRLGVRIGEKTSTYKKHLKEMQPGDTLLAGQMAGDFVLPKDEKKKLVFMAGGIGFTPFRSMIKYLIDTKQQRDIVLFYGNRAPEDIAYGELLEEAKTAFGLRTTHVLSPSPNLPVPKNAIETVTEEAIKAQVPDYAERMFYLSGPTGMVDAFKDLLTTMGVRRSHIVTDYFPGFA